jgi:transposase, IS30 family
LRSVLQPEPVQGIGRAGRDDAPAGPLSSGIICAVPPDPAGKEPAMRERCGRKHMDKDSRLIIEEGIAGGKSARRIAKEAGVSPSTVVREARSNRTVSERGSRQGANLSVRCVHRKDCTMSGTACPTCTGLLVLCRDCRTRSCIDHCREYERRMCPKTGTWPYVCPPSCSKKAYCGFPTCRYRAEEAQAAYEERLRSSRTGIDADEEELERIKAIVVPLVRQGHSFEAICIAHGDELGVCPRTLYSWQEKGILGTADIELPGKVRMRPRKRARPKGRPRIDRSGREYADFLSLPLADKVRAVQCDSVEGMQSNAHDILSMHLVARHFQLYLRKRHADAAATVAAIDRVEAAMGSCAAFEAAFGILLLDRGIEFDDFEGIERSMLEPGRRRCRVFWCDPQESNQKSECERNHEQLRRILPKRHADMDALSDADVALACSHVNSYPLAGMQDICPFGELGELVPAAALARLGVVRLPSDEVVLKPSLLGHAYVK